MTTEVLYRIEPEDLCAKVQQIKVISFDLDGTITKVNSIWKFIHDHLGVTEIANGYKERFFRGEISYDKWAFLDSSLWKGHKYSELKKIANEQIELMDDVELVIKTLKNRGFIPIVISAGLDIINDRLREVGFDTIFSNRLKVVNDTIVGGLAESVAFDNKDEILEKFIMKHNLKMYNCAAVGDGFNDVKLFKRVALGIAVNPTSDELEKIADVVIKGTTLKPLLEIFKKDC